MPKNLSSDDVSWILRQIGITTKRRGKEDVYTGKYQDKNRVVIVPRNKRKYTPGYFKLYLATSWHNEQNRRFNLEGKVKKHIFSSWQLNFGVN